MSKNTNIRVRANIAVINEQGKILLVPHFLENNKVCWYVPGGGVKYGEKLKDAARREFEEETGLKANAIKLLDIYEIIEPEKPWHSIAITYKGKITGGNLKTENHHKYGNKKMPQWFSKEELEGKQYRPPNVVNKILGIN